MEMEIRRFPQPKIHQFQVCHQGRSFIIIKKTKLSLLDAQHSRFFDISLVAFQANLTNLKLSRNIRSTTNYIEVIQLHKSDIIVN